MVLQVVLLRVEDNVVYVENKVTLDYVLLDVLLDVRWHHNIPILGECLHKVLYLKGDTVYEN